MRFLHQKKSLEKVVLKRINLMRPMMSIIICNGKGVCLLQQVEFSWPHFDR